MSFIGQSMKNRFPEWSKAKTDDSSNLSILLDTLGEEIFELRKLGLNSVEQKENLSSKPSYEISKLYEIDLKSGSGFPEDYSESNVTTILVSDDDGKSLDCFYDWGKFNLNLPKSFKEEETEKEFFDYTLDSKLKSDSGNYIYRFRKHAKHIYINLEGIEWFQNERTDLGYESDREIENSYKIIIRGINELGKKVEECISVNERKVYKTKERFLQIMPLEKEPERINGGPGLETVGLLGEIKFCEYVFKNKRAQIKKRLSIVKNNPFNNEIYGEEIYTENRLYVEYISEENKLNLIHKYLLNEYEVLSKDRKLEESFFEEVLCSFKLKDRGTDINLVDFTYDEVRNLLVGLDDQRTVHYFDIARPIFNKNNDMVDSKEVTLEISADGNYQEISEDETQKTRFDVLLSRPKGPINSFCIFKYGPETTSDGLTWNVEFLQQNKTWANEIYLFEGRSRNDLFENILPGFQFYDTLDTFGQYDYFVASFQDVFIYNDKIDFKQKLNAALEKDTNGIYLNKYSVSVPKLVPLKSILLTIESEANLDGIMLDGIENKLKIKTVGNEVVCFKEDHDRALVSLSEAKVYTEKEYSDLKITVSFSNSQQQYECDVSYG